MNDYIHDDDDLTEIFGAQVAAGIEADYQRRRAAHDEMIERHRREFEEWQQREKADREWMKAAGFWPVWPEDEEDSEVKAAAANGAPAQAAIPLDNPDAQTAALETATGKRD